MKCKKSILTVGLLFSAMSTSPAWAANNAQNFTYQGRMMNSAGTAPLDDTVDITFTILNSAKNCILYEETQSGIDLSATQGSFSAQIGSLPGALKRTSNDPGLAMGLIYQNSKLIRAAGANCSSGYTPASGESRYLRVSVTPRTSGTVNVLSPDQEITSVPQASSAESVQGLGPSDFIQSTPGVLGQNNVSLATLITLTGSGDASSLHHHDSLYVKAGTGGSPTNLGSSAYVGGNLSFGGTSSSVSVGVNRNTNSSSSGSDFSLSAGGASVGGSNQNGGSLVLSSGVSTGSGGSQIVFQTATGGSSGSSDNTGTPKMILSSAGNLGVGTLTPGARLEVDTGFAGQIGQIIKGVASQAADFFQIKDSANNLLAKIDSSGKIFGHGLDAGTLTVTNVANPVAAQDAATKAYVDTQIATGAASAVSSFNTRTGAVTLSSSDVTTALTYTPLKNSSDAMSGSLGVGAVPAASVQFQATSTATSTITAVLRRILSQTADLFQLQDETGAVLTKFDKDGRLTLPSNPVASLEAATKSYVDTSVSNSQPSGNYVTALSGDVTAAGPGSAAASVNSVGGSSAANLHAAELAVSGASGTN